MGLFRDNFDADALRAIAFARVLVAAGRGLESVLFEMARADIGLISKALAVPLGRMQAGEGSRLVLQEELGRVDHKAYRELISALLAEGPAAIARMDELSEEVQLERRIKVEAYSKRLGGFLNAVTILFMATFVPIFLRVLELIPENTLIPQFHFPSWFYHAYFVTCALVMSAMLYLMRYRE